LKKYGPTWDEQNHYLVVREVVGSMYQSEVQEQVGFPAVAEELGVWFDAERLSLEGVYLDEVTAYRARRRWIAAFEAHFLLELKFDFRMEVVCDPQRDHFALRCTFLSACGRYAFWRLTHNQAPEAQAALETAHLPGGAPCAPLEAPFAHAGGPESLLLNSALVTPSALPESPSTPERSGFRNFTDLVLRMVKYVWHRYAAGSKRTNLG
jgi:hypothetical protein